MNPPSASDQRLAPLALWRVASALLHTLFTLFGGPEKLAAKHTLTASAHKLALDWIRTAEALMRKLIFIEASAYAKTSPRKATKKHKHTRRAVISDPDTPESWRVNFRVLPPDRRRPRRHGGSHQAPAPDRSSHAGEGAGGPRFFSAWPLAERFEALIRVHNDPAPYARRLARRLRAEPQLIPRVLRAPDVLAHRIPEEADAQLDALCTQRTPCFNSS